LYFQVRTGLNMKPFGFVKFRCLSDQMELSESERLTTFGRFLRKTSLDELPQLFLILTGTMSFIGPRPLPLEYDTHYTAEQMIRFTVRPGLTGLVQISGRNALNWTERFELDIQYVKSLSIKNDIYIIKTTLLQMFRKVPDENLFSAKWYGNR